MVLVASWPSVLLPALAKNEKKKRINSVSFKVKKKKLSLVISSFCCFGYAVIDFGVVFVTYS